MALPLVPSLPSSDPPMASPQEHVTKFTAKLLEMPVGDYVDRPSGQGQGQGQG